MRNQFGGDCYRCGLWVKPGTGYFEKIRHGRGWRVQHCYGSHGGGITCVMAKEAASLSCSTKPIPSGSRPNDSLKSPPTVG